MTRGIFFDFDGVITVEKTGTPTIVSYIAKETDLPVQKVEAVYYRYNELLLRGDITHKDMWDSFCKELETDIDYGILIKSFLNITIDEVLLSYIKELKSHYVIGMITDNKADRIETILESTELNNLFDIVTISANVHARKTETKIFEDVLSKTQLKPQECVFIDNTAKNLEIPREMGFKTILFDDEKRDMEKFRDSLNEMLEN